MASFIHRLLLAFGILLGEAFSFLVFVFGVLTVIISLATGQILSFMPACDLGEFSATAWLDQNANGIRDQNEPPLPNVCVCGRLFIRKIMLILIFAPRV